MRVCIVCGARVDNQNPDCQTCDQFCTRARNAGRSRAEQMAVEVEKLKWHCETIAPVGWRGQYDNQVIYDLCTKPRRRR